MRSLVIVLAIVAVLLGVTCAKEHVLTFDDTNFKNLLEQHEWIVLLMYTPCTFAISRRICWPGLSSWIHYFGWIGHRRSTQMVFEFNSLKQLVGDDVSHRALICHAAPISVPVAHNPSPCGWMAQNINWREWIAKPSEPHALIFTSSSTQPSGYSGTTLFGCTTSSTS